ncbi:MAG: UbiD family decarboxylase [Gammaproteobacteria bacterium]|jgi:2,5-furandicarboxylate decarboxylase 1|nr:UbiD family decarboxylase [Gammaproteobacteria bacterium]MDP6149989.1 UbiD family decarboxylase [Gammaproteobacteria bacterium]MDP7093161.1 UbiD family decarboxylase [Gammaproteobacteria bacterium]MDP7271946.1 UbiD family decarboxylase [Gammaproteobacteria bacterium]MDP7418626.1 UbiD family decarboxylase [Gammaproteobacteria bacterium]
MDLVKRGLNELQAYVRFFEDNSKLVRVKSRVSQDHILSGIAKKFEGEKAVLFENVEGQDYPVFVGLYWNRPMVAKMFGTTSEELPFVLSKEIGAWRADPVDPVIVQSGPANEVIEEQIDLARLPIPRHAKQDGGRYLTSSVALTKDPDTGVRNLSIHRMMVTGDNRFTMLLEELGHVMDYFKRAEAKGQPLEMTINNGVDLGTHLAAASPAAAAPIDMDEVGIASQLRGKPAELLQSQTVDVEGFANAQFVIEGRILPDVREAEGPYAEVTGYYATREPRWAFEVTAITRRKKPIFHTILSGLEVRQAYSSVAEAGVFERIRAAVPDVKAVHFSDGCVPYNLVLQLDKQSNDAPAAAIAAAFDSLAFLKTVIVVDTDVNLFSMGEVEWAVATRCQFENDLTLIHDGIGHRLNPMVEDDKWTRLGIDATIPLPRQQKFQRAAMMNVDLSDYEITGR